VFVGWFAELGLGRWGIGVLGVRCEELFVCSGEGKNWALVYAY